MNIIARDYFRKFDMNKCLPTYLSVMITHLGRKDCLIKCVNNMIDQADIGVEIIISDDGSEANVQQDILSSLHDKSSIIVFNTGMNGGIGMAFNRARSVATSKYLLGVLDDNFFDSSFLQRIIWALDKPYVGMVNVTKHIEDIHSLVLPDGSKMKISRMGGSEVFGIRSDVWDEIEGWNENVPTTSSDCGFFGDVFSRGYFSVLIEGDVSNDAYILVDPKTGSTTENKNYVSACRHTFGDNNAPSIFSKNKKTVSRDRFKILPERETEIWHAANDSINANNMFPAWHNTPFALGEAIKLFPSEVKNLIDWEFAKVYGHDKWKGQVIKDFNLE